MGNRKECLKKALGISEYPWSSDDEETAANSNQPTLQDVRVLRRESSEPRGGVADWPTTSTMAGTSGVPPESPASPAAPAPTPVRRNQIRLDRDLFWSTLNRTPSVIGRLHDPQVAYTLRSIAPSNASQYRERNRERVNSLARSPVSDIQHILQAMSSRRNSSGAPRNSLFTPSVTNRGNRTNSSLRRTNNRTFASLPHFVRSASTSAVYQQEHRSGCVRSRLPRPVSTHGVTSLPPNPEILHVNEQSEEDIEQLAAVPPPIYPPNQPQENVPGPSRDSSADSVVLVEESTDLNPTVLPDEAERNRTATTEPNAEATANTSEGNAASSSESRQGVKRKIDAGDDTMEHLTVTAFNQSLLRLLECPVCLEWMEPPISQCRRGHLVCSRCRARLASCPVCRTTFSSVRNRAMEGVAEMLRYPCRHGCGREVRLRKRAPHEDSCPARKYQCPAPACADRQPIAHQALPHHFECEHKSMLRNSQRNTFSLKVNTVQHANWVISAHFELFHLRADIDIRSWGVIVYVAYIGPRCNAKNYFYEVTVDGQHHSRRMVYTRATHSDLESSTFNVSLQDCFHLTVDQALNFLRFRTRHSEPEKFFDFHVVISESEPVTVPREETDT